MAFIDLGDQFIALFEHEVAPRRERIGTSVLSSTT